MKRINKAFIVTTCLFIVASVTLNAVSPAYTSVLFSRIELGTIIENQNIFKVYSSIASIPISLAGKLFGAKAMPKDLANKADASNKAQDGVPRNPSDMSFSTVWHSQNMTRGQLLKLPGISGITDILCLTLPSHDKVRTMDESGFLILMAFMLMFLIELRRSSLPAPNMKLLYFTKEPNL